MRLFLTLSNPLVLRLIVIWPWEHTSPRQYVQLTLNSIALAESVISVHRYNKYFLWHCSFTPRLLQLPPFRMSRVSLLQTFKIRADRLVLRVPQTGRIYPRLASLHWLPIDSRIHTKLRPCATWLYCLYSTASVYMAQVYKPASQLRSSSGTFSQYLRSVSTHSVD